MKLASLSFAASLFGSFVALAGCGDDAGSTGGGGEGGGSTNSTVSAGGEGGASTSTSTSTSSSSSSSTTATSTSTTTTSSTGTGMPPECPSETHAVLGACDLYLQDCPADQTCQIVLDNNNMLVTECQPANGLKPLGESCSNADECQRGLQCVGGTCTPVCCPDNDEPCQGGSCNINVSDDQFGFLFMACSYAQSCTLLDPASCPDGQDCHYEQQGFATCSNPSPTPKMDGEPCMYRNDCPDSSICLNPTMPNNNTDRVCTFHCTPNSNAQPGLGGCPQGQTCKTNVNFGFPGIGYCAAP